MEFGHRVGRTLCRGCRTDNRGGIRCRIKVDLGRAPRLRVRYAPRAGAQAGRAGGNPPEAQVRVTVPCGVYVDDVDMDVAAACWARMAGHSLACFKSSKSIRNC